MQTGVLFPSLALDSRITMLELSLHAMEGDSSPRTVRLLGHVNKKSFSILLNTDSTHNFIDPIVVHRAGMQVALETSFKVTTTGGDKLHSECRSNLWMSGVRE